MLEAYFDESGIHANTGICVVAGYFGYAAQWRAQENKWRKVLAEFSFPLEDFHATDLMNSRKHQPMLKQLALAIAKSEIYPVSGGIVIDDFFSFNEKQRKFMTGATLMPNGKFTTSGKQKKPYFVPFQNAVKNVTDYTRPGRRANFFFGLDRPMGKYASTFFQEIKTRGAWGEAAWIRRLGDMATPLAKECPQLQAADLLALLTYRHMRERYDDNDWTVPPGGLLKTCLAKMRSRYDHGYETRNSLHQRIEATYPLVRANWDDH
jgi:hypothetical protein